MKKYHFVYLFSIVFLLSVSFSPSFGITVSIPEGAANPNSAVFYNPEHITIIVGDKVTWSNDDTSAHTVTSGSPSTGPLDVFDSSLFMAGATFSHTFNQPGFFKYYCMVHPWKTGTVTVLKEIPTYSGEKNIEGTNRSAEFTISGASLDKIALDLDANSLIISITANRDGYLSIQLPRPILDSKMGSTDDDFFVLIDGEEINYDETATISTSRTIKASFPSGAKEIEIIGTNALGHDPTPTCNSGEELVNGECKKIKTPQSPTIYYAINPEEVRVGQTVNFDASGSSDDGTIVKYQWWFGDGKSGTGNPISHKYQSKGQKEVVLEITDNDGLKDKKTFSINIRSNQVSPGPDPMWIIVGIVITAVGGGAGFVLSRSRKSPKSSTYEKPSDISIPQKGKSCNVCGTNIPEGKNVCPNCGDTYSV